MAHGRGRWLSREYDDLRAEACKAYVKLLKDTEELTPEQIALARESFNEGWHAHELAVKAGQS